MLSRKMTVATLERVKTVQMKNVKEVKLTEVG